MLAVGRDRDFPWVRAGSGHTYSNANSQDAEYGVCARRSSTETGNTKFRAESGTATGYGVSIWAGILIETALIVMCTAVGLVVGALVLVDQRSPGSPAAWPTRDRKRNANARDCARELYCRALDRIGADNEVVRLGAVYALEWIAVDCPVHQRTVVEVLSAFIRARIGDLAMRPSDLGPVVPRRPAVDIQAAVTVLARLPVLDGVPRGDLTGARLTGPAALRGIQAVEGSLSAIDLTGADLRGAALTGLNLTAARLGGADLTDAHLGEADLSYAWLGGTDLSRAWLEQADLTGASLGGANLSRAWLAGADLTGASLGGATFARACLEETNLTRAWLGGANLASATGLTQRQVDLAYGDGWTRLPAALVRPASWASAGTSGGRPADDREATCDPYAAKVPLAEPPLPHPQYLEDAPLRRIHVM